MNTRTNKSAATLVVGVLFSFRCKGLGVNDSPVDCQSRA